MRIPLACMKCFQERGTPDDIVYPAELQDNGLYRMTCRAGHETVTSAQEQKFELLFELAAHAIVDGYYREAVLSFTSSLERFYEFYIRVICRKHGIVESISSFDDAWRNVAAQSERQLGAYIFVYLLENGSPAQLLPQNLITLRNNVVHRGKIPTKKEASDYGQSILELIVPVLNALKTKYADHVQSVVLDHIRSMHKAIAGRPHVSFMSTPTTISIVRTESLPQPSLADTLARLESKRH
jgi:hypothetical protein